MKRNFAGSIRMTVAATLLATMTSAGFAATFGSGNLVVVRVGDGTVLLATNEAAPVFLDEYTTAGTLVQSIALPTTVSGANARLTLGGLNTAEGALNLSADGAYLTLGGYDAAVGATGIVATAAATQNRVVGVVGFDGVVDTSTKITDGFDNGRVASVSSTDGTEFWITGAGTGGGMRYSAALGGTTSVSIGGTPNNLRVGKIANGQLYSSASFNTGGFLGVCTIGTGIPTTTGQTTTLLNGFPTTPPHSNFGYHFLNSSTLFVVDDGAAVDGGGLQKWTESAGTWTQSGAPFPYIAPTTNPGLRGLTGTASGPNVTLYGTTAEATGNSIVAWVSTDGGATGTFSTVVAAPAGTNPTVFRGIAMAPATTAAVSSWEVYD